MAQINYDIKGFYKLNPIDKRRIPISSDSLPEEVSPGAHIFFDYHTSFGNPDGLIFQRTVSREQFIAGCQETYQPPVFYTRGNRDFSEKHLPVDTIKKI